MRTPPRSVVLLAALASAACSDSHDPRPDDVPVRVGMVTVDTNNAPVVVLEEQDGSRWLPIWIGTAEAHSIAAEMEEQQAPRPNTHDLARRLIHGLEGEVLRVVVTDLRSSTYYAVMTLRSAGGIVEIDSRPSDAIAIALRTDAPIFVRAAVFDKAGAAGDAAGNSEQSVRWIPELDDAHRIGIEPATLVVSR